MFRNYFKTVWRNAIRNRRVTFINLFGLSLALVAFIFITLWIQNELNFDSYHKDAKDIYLVQTKYASNEEPNAVTAFPLAETIKRDKDVEYAARASVWLGTLNIDGELFNQKIGMAVDSEWFKIFDYKIVKGSFKSFSSKKFSIIFTESRAKQLFESNDPIGKIIKLDTTLYQVSAIIEDNPVNSSFQFDMIVPMAARMAYRQGDFDNWNNASYRTFVKVYPDKDIKEVARNLNTLSSKEAGMANYSVVLQSLKDLHFDTNSNDSQFRRGSFTAVFVFGILALLLIITASINYINLTIAKADTRTKEVSIRRIIGSTRKQLFIQFLSESFLICVMALIISVILLSALLPIFNSITETEFQISAASKILWITLLGTLLLITLLNGVFPAITLSYFKPLHYLQGNTILKFKNVLLRKVLVVFQFITGIIFIVGTIVVFEQMRLAKASASQYNRSQVVSFRVPYTALRGMNDDGRQVAIFIQKLKNDLQKSAYIQTVSAGNNAIDGGLSSSGVKNWYWNKQDTSLKYSISSVVLDAKANDIFNLQLKEGRWFNDDNADKRNYILNETAVKDLRIPQPVIGQVFARNGEDTGQIIAVVKDFAFNSLYNKIRPLVISNTDNEWKLQFFVKVAPGNIPKAMDIINATWKQHIKEAPLDYHFMDETFDSMYKNDLKISKLVLIFSCISVSISALGLLGLSAFVAERRKKEIGIRKVLGASVSQISSMLSKDFLVLIIVAFVIAVPISWWAMDKWLQHFAYRINIGWEIFLIAGIVVLCIGFVTTIFQSVKAALANPVKSLRTE